MEGVDAPGRWPPEAGGVRLFPGNAGVVAGVLRLAGSYSGLAGQPTGLAIGPGSELPPQLGLSHDPGCMHDPGLWSG
jgi:hypothetical protein